MSTGSNIETWRKRFKSQSEDLEVRLATLEEKRRKHQEEQAKAYRLVLRNNPRVIEGKTFNAGAIFDLGGDYQQLEEWEPIDGPNMLIGGHPGSGKTWFTIQLINYLDKIQILDGVTKIGKRFKPRYRKPTYYLVKPISVIDEMAKNYYARKVEIISQMNSCDILVMDGLGQERANNAFWNTVFLQVLETRLNSATKKTIITTSLDSQTILKVYPKSITWRLFDKPFAKVFINRVISPD